MAESLMTCVALACLSTAQMPAVMHAIRELHQMLSICCQQTRQNLFTGEQNWLPLYHMQACGSGPQLFF